MDTFIAENFIKLENLFNYFKLNMYNIRSIALTVDGCQIRIWINNADYFENLIKKFNISYYYMNLYGDQQMTIITFNKHNNLEQFLINRIYKEIFPIIKYRF